MFCYVHHALLVLYLTAHFYSTITRAVRYLPEFFQMMIEDSIVMTVVTTVQILYHDSTNISTLIAYMDTFSQADKNLLRKCEKKSQIISLVFLFGLIMINTGAILDPISPMTEEELSMMAYIYRTENPGRKLATPVRVPFIDETRSWYYEVIYTLQVYVLIALVPPTLVNCILIPIIVTHLQGQYKILSRHIKLFGKKYEDSNGKLIMCVDIEKNQYLVLPETVRICFCHGKRMKAIYEHQHLREVLVFHQKLIDYESKVSIHHYFRQVLVFHQKLMDFESAVHHQFIDIESYWLWQAGLSCTVVVHASGPN